LLTPKQRIENTKVHCYNQDLDATYLEDWYRYYWEYPCDYGWYYY
jgi:hypothetical protein